MKMLVSSDPTLATSELYNPLTNLRTHDLMEKFNLAFYEAQNVSRNDLIRTFKQEVANENNSNHSEEKFNDEDLIDYLISEDSTLSPTECDITFDFNDFEQDFDNNVNKTAVDQTILKTEINLDSETYLNANKNAQENLTQYSNIYIQCVPNSPFEDLYPNSPLTDNNLYQNCDQKPILNLSNNENQIQYMKSFIHVSENQNKQSLSREYQNVGLDDLDLEVLSNVDSWNNDLSDRTQDFGNTTLPPVNTITKNNVDFNNYVRTIPINDCGYFKQDFNNKSEFGHLLSTTACQNNPLENILTNDTPPPTPTCDSTVDQRFFSSTCDDRSTHRRRATQVHEFNEDNHMVLTQTEALLNDDPLLSSSSILFNSHEGEMVGEIYDGDYDGTDSEETVSSSTNYVCKWEQCYQLYDSQRSLVKHIEKCHVELKRGDEFTCFWENCPRKTKPFNARYKLLIHMRVHSGEKPNKCMFKGCNKAFSRLENLKIHQRSHTGERPYVCQFTGCTKCFSNSSDRAKHQRTHFDTKPYACQVRGCPKKYTDPSSLRKHVKNHSYEEQQQIKRGKLTSDSCPDTLMSNPMVRQFLDPSKQKAQRGNGQDFFYNEVDHSYSNNSCYFQINSDSSQSRECSSVKRGLKNKIQNNRLKKLIF